VGCQGKGIFSPSTLYSLNDVVSSPIGSFLYVGREPSIGSDLLDSRTWQSIASTTTDDTPYGDGWNNSLVAPTQNAVYDVVETKTGLVLGTVGSHMSARFSNGFTIWYGEEVTAYTTYTAGVWVSPATFNLLDVPTTGTNTVYHMQATFKASYQSDGVTLASPEPDALVMVKAGASQQLRVKFSNTVSVRVAITYVMVGINAVG